MKALIFDEWRLVLRVPAGLPPSEAEAARRALDGPALRGRVLRAVRDAFRGRPELVRVTVAVEA